MPRPPTASRRCSPFVPNEQAWETRPLYRDGHSVAASTIVESIRILAGGVQDRGPSPPQLLACLSGKSRHRLVQSPKEIFLFSATQISAITAAVSSLNEGRIMIVTNVGMGCGGRGSVGRETDRRRTSACERSRARRRTMLRRTANRVVRHPFCVKLPVAICDPNRIDEPSSGSDGDKTNSSPGRARHKVVKPLRGECRMFP